MVMEYKIFYKQYNNIYRIYMSSLERDLNILGIDPSQEVTEDLVIKQYRKMAMKYHPDKNKSEGATQMMQEINRSYNNLLEKINTMPQNNQYFNTTRTYQPQTDYQPKSEYKQRYEYQPQGNYQKQNDYQKQSEYQKQGYNSDYLKSNGEDRRSNIDVNDYIPDIDIFAAKNANKNSRTNTSRMNTNRTNTSRMNTSRRDTGRGISISTKKNRKSNKKNQKNNNKSNKSNKNKSKTKKNPKSKTLKTRK